jgi:hypothetical protein
VGRISYSPKHRRSMVHDLFGILAPKWFFGNLGFLESIIALSKSRRTMRTFYYVTGK